MVGVPRSNGCGLCVKRRVRCDEARPACGNCIKYGADCPGYDRGLKFIAGKHVVRTRGTKQNKGNEPGRSSKTSPPVKQETEPWTKDNALGRAEAALLYADFVSAEPEPSLSQALTVRFDVFCDGKQEDVNEQIQRTLSLMPRPSGTLPTDRVQFIGTLINNFNNTSAGPEAQIIGRLFSKLEHRLGSNELLDTASCSLAMHILGKKCNDQNVIAKSRAVYGRSLWTLQRALNHRKEWKSAETLCATTILCVFELFAGTGSPDSWQQHAGGVIRLMETRGPKAYNSEWERATLFSFRGMICMHAIFTGTDCFLAKPEWESVCRMGKDAKMTGPASLETVQLHLFDDYFFYLAKVPEVLRFAYRVREGKPEPTDLLPAERMRIAQVAAATRNGLMEWFSTILPVGPHPTEIPTRDPESIYPTVLLYNDPWLGCLHMGYYATMLILQGGMMIAGYPEDFRALNQLFVLNIFRSLETVGEGMMGPFRCGYSIRIAFEFTDEKTKDWVKMWLDRFSKIYAATNKSVFPK